MSSSARPASLTGRRPRRRGCRRSRGFQVSVRAMLELMRIAATARPPPRRSLQPHHELHHPALTRRSPSSVAPGTCTTRGRRRSCSRGSTSAGTISTRSRRRRRTATSPSPSCCRRSRGGRRRCAARSASTATATTARAGTRGSARARSAAARRAVVRTTRAVDHEVMPRRARRPARRAARQQGRRRARAHARPLDAALCRRPPRRHTAAPQWKRVTRGTLDLCAPARRAQPRRRRRRRRGGGVPPRRSELSRDAAAAAGTRSPRAAERRRARASEPERRRAPRGRTDASTRRGPARRAAGGAARTRGAVRRSRDHLSADVQADKGARYARYVFEAPEAARRGSSADQAADAEPDRPGAASCRRRRYGLADV